MPQSPDRFAPTRSLRCLPTGHASHTFLFACPVMMSGCSDLSERFYHQRPSAAASTRAHAKLIHKSRFAIDASTVQRQVRSLCREQLSSLTGSWLIGILADIRARTFSNV
jgi:hypothetical protein